MKPEMKKRFYPAFGLLIAFVLWTLLVSLVDVKPIGPENSEVGFAALNGAFHKFTGENMWMYDMTDLLSVIPLAVIAFFGLVGLAQWIKRKALVKVDFSILVLGGFYAIVMAVFVLFEKVVINYRPVLIEGVLEASYPSSTTMLCMCVLPTAMMQFYQRINDKSVRRIILIVGSAFTSFMVLFRLFSGVHWLTDIIGGALFSAGMVLLYDAACKLKK